MRLIAILLLAFWTQDTRQPIPDATAVKNADKLIREIFKDDFTKKAPADMAALAKKLIAQGEQPENDAPTRYALLKTAHEVALQGGDGPLALRAIDLLAKSFVVNAASLKMAALQTTAKNVKTPEEMKAAAAGYLTLADEALAADDPDTAAKAADAASQLAKKAKELPLMSRADLKIKEATTRKAAVEKLAKAKETLAKTPDDPGANQLVGYHLCAVKGDWAAGLPLLARGNDPTTKGPAEKDLAAPADAAGQAAAGDGWWDLAEKTPEGGRTAIRARAAFWYEKSVDKLTGLSKTKVRTRLIDLRQDQFGPKSQWVALNDPKTFGLNTPVGEAMEVTAEPGKAQSVECTLPAGEFDAIAARIRFKPGMKAHGGVALEGRTILAYIDYAGKFFMFTHLVERKWALDFEKACGDREEYHICIVVADGEYRAYLDGVEMCRVKTKNAVLVNPGLQASHGPSLFDQVRVRKK